MRQRRLRGIAALVALFAIAALPASASAVPTVTMSGSTSVAPLAAKLARAYIKRCHHCVKFKLLQGGSDRGVADVSTNAGGVDIGNSSRDPKPSDPPGLVFNKIAQDAICLITNSQNRVPSLSPAQVRQIFSGQTSSWGSVDGATVGGDVSLFVRTAASGTQDAFDKIFMKPSKVSSLAKQKASNGLVQSSVASDPNGIGYVSLAFTNGVNPVAYDGKACNLRNAKSGQYGGVRNFWMVTRGRATGAARAWIRWITHDAVAQRVIATDWVPLI